MLTSGVRPVIFVDIDGVLIPFRTRSTNTHRGSTGGTARAANDCGNPVLERLDPGDGRHLIALPGDLVWASTWRAEANEVVAPRLGLPALPLVDWPDADEVPQRGMHWKTVPIARCAAGRPLSGSTTRSPTRTGGGSPRTTRSRPCCTASTRTGD